MTPLIATAAIAALAGWLGHAALTRRALRGARHDPVTGLPARDAWTRQARRILRSGTHTVALIDLDRFKQVNDTYGHRAGDHVLAVAAARMRTWTDRAGGGACGRLGGDEFVVVTRRPVTAAKTAELAAALAAPVTLPGGAGTIPAAASVGTACCAGRRGLPAALAAADAAMYQTKRTGAGYRISGPAVTETRPAAVPARRTRHHGPAAPAPETVTGTSQPAAPARSTRLAMSATVTRAQRRIRWQLWNSRPQGWRGKADRLWRRHAR